MEEVRKVAPPSIKTGSNLVSAQQLSGMSFETWDFRNEKLLSLLVAERPSVNAYINISGVPGSGKSTLCFMFAKELAKYGNILYVASEEKVGETLRLKAEKANVTEDNVIFFHTRSFDDVKKELNKGIYRFCFIDSLNKLNVTPQNFENFKESNKNIMFFNILQSTKDGKHRGSQELAHDSDVNLSVHEGGHAVTDKGRFGKGDFWIFGKPID